MNNLNYCAQLGKRLAAPLVCIALYGAAANVSAFAYEIIDLGVDVTPRDINNSGIVVGARNVSQYPGNAFRYSVQSGLLEDLDGTVAYAVNDAGTIVGSTLTGAFLLAGSRYQNWDDQGAYGINELGHASGNKAGINPYRVTSTPYNPAVYEGKKWTVMDIAQIYPRGTRQGVYADILTLSDINDNGYAVGSKRRYGLAGSSAILITPPYNEVRDLADVTYLPTSYGGAASAINNSNSIVGTTGNDARSGTYSYAFLYDGNSVTNLGVLPGGLRSSAADINETNLVVGSSETAAGNHAFMWNGQDGISDLNNHITAPGWELVSATAVNDLGDIVGTGLLNGDVHGFILTNGQTPPPANNQAPVAITSTDVTSGKAPLTVYFTGGSSYDPDGQIINYAWDFGDGSGSNAANVEHVYTVPATYIAMLTVTDNQGMTATAVVEIVVKKSRGKSSR